MGGACVDRRALVTGASRGIGAAIATRLAREGATVVLTARTSEPTAGREGSLREVADDIAAAGGRAEVVAADLSRPEDRARLMDEVARGGPLDILVNNAAVAFLATATEYPDRRYRLMFELLVHAPFDLIQRAVPAIARTRSRVDPEHLLDRLRPPHRATVPPPRRARAVHGVRDGQGGARASDNGPGR